MSLKANPSVLIGSCLVPILPYDPIRTVCTETAMSRVRLFEKASKFILNKFAECHIINCLLTLLVRGVLGNIGPRWWLHGPGALVRSY